MTLTEKDLLAIKDVVGFEIEKSEIRMEAIIDKKIVKVIEKIDREVSDLAETNREFLAHLDNHEKRICKLELKVSAK